LINSESSASAPLPNNASHGELLPKDRDSTNYNALPEFKKEIVNIICSYDWDVKTAVAIAYAESGLNANAHNYNPKSKDDSYGIFQINLYGKLKYARPSPEELLNPEKNIAFAYSMYKSQGWKPWGAYNNKSYQIYLKNPIKMK